MSCTLTRAHILQRASEEARKGRIAAIVVKDESERETMKTVALSAMPKVQIRATLTCYILFESGGQLHFRYDENMQYGGSVDVFKRDENDHWEHIVVQTPKLKDRFELINEPFD